MTSDWLNLSWKSLVGRGVIAIIFGIVALAWTPATAITLALLWGIWALVDGFGSFFQAFEAGSPVSARIFFVIMGIIAILAGIIAILSPGLTAVTLTWILGIWLVVRGIFEFIGAFASTVSTPRWLLILIGLLDILLGILFAANPGAGALSVAWVLGMLAFIWGITMVVTGLSMRGRDGS